MAKLRGEKKGISQLWKAHHCPLEKEQLWAPSSLHWWQMVKPLPLCIPHPQMCPVGMHRGTTEQGETNQAGVSQTAVNSSAASKKNVGKLLVLVLFTFLLAAPQQWRFAAHHHILGE